MKEETKDTSAPTTSNVALSQGANVTTEESRTGVVGCVDTGGTGNVSVNENRDQHNQFHFKISKN